MRKFTVIACTLIAIIASAQFSGSGFYRVHNVGTDSYICIRGTKFKKTTNPDAFWSCILMLKNAEQTHVSDPGSIIYIPDMGQTSLCAQGVSTYSLTGLWLTIDPATEDEGGLPTYLARTRYNNFPCIFRDYGNGLTAGYLECAESRWWIEPVNASTIETSYLGVKPVDKSVTDQDGYYWATMCCDFPFMLPVDGGVEGGYTIREIKLGIDSCYYAEPVKLYGQGDVVPAATPVLLKCKAADASGNKVIPVGEIANCTEMPLVNDLLMGDYFSSFINHANLTDNSVMAEYIPAQAMMANEDNLALGVGADGKLGFYPLTEGTYMAANSAWLSLSQLEADNADLDVVYLGMAPFKGDLNGDGELTVSDVTSLISYVLSVAAGEQTKSLPLKVLVADINGDGIVTVSDVTMLLRLVLSAEDQDVER